MTATLADTIPPHAAAPANADTALSAARFWLLCTLVALLALALRLPTLASRSLWLDETYSAWFAAVPLRELWTSVPLYETHPPFYYTLLKGWIALFGNGEAAMRSLSVLGGVLTVFLLPACARLARLGGRAERVALLAALFLATNAYAINFSQQARPYALQALSGGLAVFFAAMLVRELAHRQPQERLRTWIVGLALSAGVTLWLHNTGIFAAFGIWTGMTAALLLAVPGPRGRQALAVAAAGVGALLVWSPFIPILVQQNAAMAHLSYWIRFKPANTIAAWSVISGAPVMHYPVALLVLLGFAWLWKRARAHFWLLGCVLALPILALAGYSLLVKPVFLSRVFEWLAPLGMVLAALGVFSLRPRWRLPAIAVILVLSAWSVANFYRSQTENWREMLAGLAHDSRPGDLVLAFPNEVQMPVTYYMKHAGAPSVTYLPGPFPALGLDRRYTGNSGAPNIAREDIDHLRELLPRYRRVWLIERLANLYDPDDLVMRELGGRYRLVKKIDGIGGTIRLYERP
ncbi:glycosyltransferase family 39 protein [uncultured Massilia sp.]|uniref:glycosyltransferase family 39 protein n=1 Tax=uncultured Massilia sp. TaxID=169973 RepID=UPI0025EB8DC6|nr:glycosyltransferase family 39 protein [uncultured Massilia sp.]